MDATKKQSRHESIVSAAYRLLAAKGYDGTSMLSIAKAAQASNETLYRWYGDKRGLFERMVEDNAALMKHLLETSIEKQDDPRKTLEGFSVVFLETLLDERAILLNRVAATDPTGELGRTISAKGRDVIEPLIGKLMSAIKPLQQVEEREMTRWFVSLLVGDLQIKRVIGVQPILNRQEIVDRCQTGLAAFYRLVGVE